MHLLTFTECHALVEAAIDCQLAEPELRQLLIPDLRVRATLPELKRPQVQLVADLDELAVASWPHEPHPLLVWLGRARDLAGARGEAATFARLHDEVAQRLAGPWGMRADPSWGHPRG